MNFTYYSHESILNRYNSQINVHLLDCNFVIVANLVTITLSKFNRQSKYEIKDAINFSWA